MTLSVLRSFQNSDSSKSFNDAVKDILKKGVYSGGALSPGTGIEVLIAPFAAIALEGMTVRDDTSNTSITKMWNNSFPTDPTALKPIEDGKTYKIGIVVKYQSLLPATLIPIAIQTSNGPPSDFSNYPDKEFFISFGTLDLPNGALAIFSNNLTLDETAGEGSSVNTQTIVAYMSALLSTHYNVLSFDTFASNTRVDQTAGVTTAEYNPQFARYEAEFIGEKVQSVNIRNATFTGTLNEAMVLLETNDPNPTIQLFTSGTPVTVIPGIPYGYEVSDLAVIGDVPGALDTGGAPTPRDLHGTYFTIENFGVGLFDVYLDNTGGLLNPGTSPNSIQVVYSVGDTSEVIATKINDALNADPNFTSEIREQIISSNGTVTVTNGSDSVIDTGSTGTSWLIDGAVPGNTLIVNNVSYNILRVISDSVLQLDTIYTAATDLAAAYDITEYVVRITAANLGLATPIDASNSFFNETVIQPGDTWADGGTLIFKYTASQNDTQLFSYAILYDKI